MLAQPKTIGGWVSYVDPTKAIDGSVGCVMGPAQNHRWLDWPGPRLSVVGLVGSAQKKLLAIRMTV